MTTEWVTVPREPTEAMVAAGRSYAVPSTQAIIPIYTAMLSACPPSPPVSGEVVETDDTADLLNVLCEDFGCEPGSNRIHWLHDQLSALADMRDALRGCISYRNWEIAEGGVVPDELRDTWKRAEATLSSVSEAHPRTKFSNEVVEALRSLLFSARLLHQNSEICIEHHHGLTPSKSGWFASCLKSIERAEAVLVKLEERS